MPTRLLALLALLAAPAAADEPKPIRALLVCGGCCHDYTNQKDIIAKGLADRAHIEVTAVQQGGTSTASEIPLYEDADWSKGYDVILHDECFSDAKKPEWLDRILKPHRDGLPGVVIHCAMHSYHTGSDEWFQFCGVTSRRHGAAYEHEVLNADPEHPIMRGFGPAWANPAGELYWIERVWPTAHPLAVSKNKEKGNDEVCVWTNEYGDKKTRVFGTTVGHHNETVSSPEYLDLLTRGTLWAAGKLDDKAYLKPPAPKRVQVNIARGVQVAASSEEAGKGNVAAHAVDGKAGTRWCASGPELPQWLRLDLGKPAKLTGLRIDWESGDGAYRVKVEGSIDDKNWHTLVDATKDAKPSPTEAKLDGQHWRWVRVTCVGTGGGWASIREVELFGDQTAVVGPTTGANEQEQKLLSGVQAPDGYELTLFAAPPAANYPVFVAASPEGDLYVSSDKNGSLDRAPHRGSVVKLRDTDGDGRADGATRFVPEVDSPRGLVWDVDRLYLMHPPHLSAYVDKDGAGVSDEETVLVKDIAFTFKDRPADHTSNGVTLGVDGWLYLAIGDFGFMEATGADGRTLQLRGGGVVRVRPDGSGLELYSRGTRNILEVGLDPLLNGFARDNTNDGGGWDIRLHHFSGGEEHGYPSLFKNFSDEIIQPLADYGGGSGCGALFLDEPGFPAGDSPAFYSADWGRERVFRHHLTPDGATFKADQSDFLVLPRVTDLDVDAQGHLFASSWKGATFTYAGEDVGFVVRLTPKGHKAAPLPDFAAAPPAALVKLLESPSHRIRLEAQRRLLRRPLDDATVEGLRSLASDRAMPLPSRVVALFALKQAQETASHEFLARLVDDATIREFALRALADRLDQREGVPTDRFVQALKDENPRVRLQAARGLARLGDTKDSPALATLLGDPDPIVAHTAVHAMIDLKAADAAFAVVDRTDAPTAARAGALRVLQGLHETGVVDGLIRRLGLEPDAGRRLGLFAALARLHFRPGAWKGDSWGTRPDTSGPYYQAEPWEATPRIASALRSALGRASAGDLAGLNAQLDRHKIALAEGVASLLARAAKDASLVPTAVEEIARGKAVPAAAVPILARAANAKQGPSDLRAKAVVALAKVDTEEAVRAGLTALPRLEDDPAGRRARAAFLASPALGEHLGPIEQAARNAKDPAADWAVAALLAVADGPAASPESRSRAEKTIGSLWDAPKSRARVLRAVALGEFDSHADKVRAAASDPDPAVAAAASEAARRLDLDSDAARGPRIAALPADDVLAAVSKQHGEARRGERLFRRLGCVNCHTASTDETPKGPYLGNIARTYKRPELAEAILRPSKSIAQGFATNVFGLDDGRTLTGFVVQEAADAVTIRDGEGKETTIPTASIEQRAKSDVSVMPEGLVKDITPAEFAGLLDYLESLADGPATGS